MTRMTTILVGLVAAGALGPVAAAGQSDAIVRQASRCALHAHLSATSAQDPAAKAAWGAQKNAMTTFALRSGASPADVQRHMDAFGQEIVQAQKSKSLPALATNSAKACEAFANQHLVGTPPAPAPAPKR